MLRGLSIRDIVLIERLDLELGPGLAVLTGETGAGKSIVLDALGLALGGRGERGLVRGGASQGTVTAEFEVTGRPDLQQLLNENAIAGDGGELVLRRTLGADGRSRGFVNDTPVSTGLLRQLGDRLVEVHGQFEQRGLLDPRLHRDLLDAFGRHGELARACREACVAWREALVDERALRETVDAARREEEYLRHRERELADLAPEAEEEEGLAARRQELQHRDKLVAAVQEALAAGTAAVERLAAATRRLDRVAGLADERLAAPLQALERAAVEAGEAEAALESALRGFDGDGGGIEAVEDRLFALRDAARKHRVPVEGLPALLEATRRLLEGIDAGADRLIAAGRRVEAAREGYRAAAGGLSAARATAATTLAAAVAAELPPLRLERARFRVALMTVAEEDAGPDGLERVQFEVATNPGQSFGPLARIASGGELSRFMLALKVVLARLDAVGTLIFDEVDAGIGGAVADAVGERLARLGRERQVLVVTHAPQIAARADSHLTVRKRVAGGRTLVEVEPLGAPERRDEIARMLAGAEVTEAARAAADSLIRVGAG